MSVLFSIFILLPFSTSLAQPASAQSTTIPTDVFADLAHIDKLLTKLIGDVHGGALDGVITIKRIAAIEKAKREMVTSYFDQPIYGLKFSQVFFGLDCLDRDLGQGIGEAEGQLDQQRIADTISKGQKCKESLEIRLRGASGVPADVFADLAHIDKLLTKLIGDVHVGALDGAITIKRIAEIEKAKREMVKTYFEQPIYGLKFSQVFFGLDCLDRDLGQGIGEAEGQLDQQRIADTISKGQKCKESLESALNNAAASSSQHGSSGAPKVSGTYAGSVVVARDPAGHSCCVIPAKSWNVLQVRDTTTGAITITLGPVLPGIDLTSPLSGTGAPFVATGMGAVAGHPGTEVDFSGSVTPQDGLKGTLTVGKNGALPTGQSITFDVNMTKVM